MVAEVVMYDVSMHRQRWYPVAKETIPFDTLLPWTQR